MEVLYYTNKNVEKSEIQDLLASRGFRVTRITERPTMTSGVGDFKFLISDRSRFIIPKDVINHFGGNAINLHPSLLPHNRGDQPLLWAAVEGRPYGVTIHKVSENFDEGPIVCQSQVSIPSQFTLREAYNLVRLHMVSLFQACLDSGIIPDLASKNCDLIPNVLELGSTRSREQGKAAVKILPFGWDTTIDYLKQNSEKFLSW
jgi:methionyl-tRNA formyltransferase